jgi:hypothetical protein
MNEFVGDIKSIMINGKFLMHKDMGGMSDAFVQLMILEDDHVKTAIGRRRVIGVSVTDASVNIVISP